MYGRRSDARLGQAVLLTAGAIFLVFVVAPVDGRFYWTPLTIGIACFGAAAVGGRNSGAWAPACALIGWGAAVAVVGAASPELDASGLYLAGAGLGIVAGLLLERRGFRIDPMVLALTIALGGGLLALTTKAEGVLADARTYAVVLGVVAVAKIARAVAADRPPAQTRRTAALLVAWAGAALIAGVPSGAASSASADEGERSDLSSATHTGPECMAGRAVPDP